MKHCGPVIDKKTPRWQMGVNSNTRRSSMLPNGCDLFLVGNYCIRASVWRIFDWRKLTSSLEWPANSHLLLIACCSLLVWLSHIDKYHDLYHKRMLPPVLLLNHWDILILAITHVSWYLNWTYFSQTYYCYWNFEEKKMNNNEKIKKIEAIVCVVRNGNARNTREWRT